MRNLIFIFSSLPLIASAQDWGRYQYFVPPPTLNEIQVVRTPQIQRFIPPPQTPPTYLPKPGQFYFPPPPNVGQNMGK